MTRYVKIHEPTGQVLMNIVINEASPKPAEEALKLARCDYSKGEALYIRVGGQP